MNPYEPPRAAMDPDDARSLDKTQWVKWGYLALAILAPFLGMRDDRSLLLAGIVVYVVGVVVRDAWLALVWASLAPRDRKTAKGMYISPAKAFGYAFIPCFNLGWMFIATRGACEAINAVLRRAARPERAPAGLATAACIVEIVASFAARNTPMVAFILPFLWFAFMVQTDGARETMRSIVVETETEPAPTRERVDGPTDDASYDARLDAELKQLDE